MQQIEANQELELTPNLGRSIHPVTQDKGNIYRHKTSEEPLRVSVSPPMRVHQHFVQRQQYYTGDA
ncbi:MAG TPA: hypothetical protein VGJ73_11265 [Verrucomicrobiae bacterium]